MYAVQTFYLSRILGNKVWTEINRSAGKLVDLVIDVAAVRPQVTAVKIKMGNQYRIVDFSHFSIVKTKNQYMIHCELLKDREIATENTLFLVKHILDKQIVDMDGRKVVRVNDLKLAIVSTGVYLLAADIGFEGLLRRLGVAKPLKKMLKPLGITIPSRFLLWDDVEAIDSFRHGIMLSKSYSKLSALHPSDLADILEELDRAAQAAVFASLEVAKAADVLEELETEAQLNVIENLTVDQATVMLETMPTDEVADILEEMNEDQADQLLNRMKRKVSEEVRELMNYPEKAVGSLMTTEFVSFQENLTVYEAMNELRRQKPDPEILYYLYIVDQNNRLIASISLRDLLFAKQEAMLSEMMDRNFLFIFADEQIEILNEMMTKYNLLGVPVVDPQMSLIGMVHIHDVVDHLLKSSRRRR